MTLERYIRLFKAAGLTKRDWDNLVCVYHESPMVVPREHSNDGPVLVLDSIH